MFITITRPTFFNGVPASPGEVYELDDVLAEFTIACKKAREATRKEIAAAQEGGEAPAPEQPAKKRPKKVTKQPEE